MPELKTECKFETTADMIQFTTKTNGDRIEIHKLELSQEQATSLAWLVNADDKAVLEWEVKLKAV